MVTIPSIACFKVTDAPNLAFAAGAGRVLLQRPVPWVGLELADSEGDFLLLAVDAQHDGFDFLIWLKHVRRFGDALGPGEFRDMNKTFDARLEFDEGAI